MSDEAVATTDLFDDEDWPADLTIDVILMEPENRPWWCVGGENHYDHMVLYFRTWAENGDTGGEFELRLPIIVNKPDGYLKSAEGVGIERVGS